MTGDVLVVAEHLQGKFDDVTFEMLGMEGMKSAATIIAVNTDENAPIFNFAHYGMTEDLFDVCEELTEAIEDR